MNTAIAIIAVFTNIVSAFFTETVKAETVLLFCSRLKILPARIRNNTILIYLIIFTPLL
jgi:hypothetical protein